VLDIVYAGHLAMMRNAKAIAGEDGKLVVGNLTDEAVMEKKVPVLPFAERMELAAAIRYADLVVAQETCSPLANVRSFRPDVLSESTSHDDAAVEEARESWRASGER
jgi:glycerol-3-phosphate cytidylyltransferase-like family protein